MAFVQWERREHEKTCNKRWSYVKKVQREESEFLVQNHRVRGNRKENRSFVYQDTKIQVTEILLYALFPFNEEVTDILEKLQ